MRRHTESIRKKLVQTKYLLGVTLIAFVLLIVLFMRSEAIIAPQTEDTAVPPTNPNWICPATVWISCPSDSSQNEESCSEEYIDWVRSSCPDFQGVTNQSTL